MGRPAIGIKIECKKRFYTYGSCVYKLFYNKVYVWVKAKNCYGSLKMIEKSMNQYMKGAESQMKDDNLYKYFFDYIKKHKNGTFNVEVLSEPEATDYELLMLEEEMVKQSRTDTKCLNNISGAYINQWNPETGEYNWLSRASVANFIRNRRRVVSLSKKKKKKASLAEVGASEVKSKKSASSSVRKSAKKKSAPAKAGKKKAAGKSAAKAKTAVKKVVAAKKKLAPVKKATSKKK